MQLFLDLDGTVIDARARLYRVFADLTGSDAVGFDEYWVLKRAMRSNEWILGTRLGYDAAGIAAFVSAWMRAIEAPGYLALDVPFPHTVGALDALASRGELCLVTARQSEAAVHDQLARLGLAGYFRRVFVTRQERSKQEALAGVAVRPSDVFVGDTGVDVQAARGLGVVAVAVLSGFRDRANLEPYQPDWLYDHLGAFAAGYPWLADH